MQIIKPLQLSLINRTFTYQRQHYLSMGTLLGFKLTTGEVILEQALWEKIAATPEIKLLDAGLPKAKAEYLVYGCAETPQGKPCKELQVSIELAHLKKQLLVQGAGYWRGLPGVKRQVVDQPFTRLSLGQHHAFGGKDFADNPEGMGYKAVNTETEENLYPITQLQLLNKPAEGPGKETALAFTTAMDFMAPQRQKYAGTYDDAYQQQAMPGLPDDFNWHFCQDALPDQRFTTSLLPKNARYRLVNLNADFPIIEGQLPFWQVKAWLKKESSDSTNISADKIDLQPETVFFLPNEDLGILLYRGQVKVKRDDARDIAALMLALEDPAASKPDEHYLDQLTKRSVQETSWRYLMDTQPLLPKQLTCGMALLMNQGDKPSLEMPQIEKAEALAEKKKAEALEEIEAQKQKILTSGGITEKALNEKFELPTNVSPKWQEALKNLENKILPKKEDGSPDLTKVDFEAMNEIKRLADKVKDEELAKIKAEVIPQLETLLQQPEIKEQHPKIRQKIAAILNPPPLPWPRLNLDQDIERIKDDIHNALSEIDKLETSSISSEQKQQTTTKLTNALEALKKQTVQLQEAQKKVKETYLMGAEQMNRGAPLLSPEALNERRNQVIAAIKNNQPLPTDDLADLDLSNLNLDKVDFSNCYMEGINLSGSSLKKARLSGAIMVYARLDQVDFSEADLSRANLGATSLTASNFYNAKLNNTNFNKASLTACQFVKANLNATQWMEAKLKDCNFTQASLQQLNLIDQTIDQCNFTECNLSKGNFVNPLFKDCNFNKVIAEGTNFIKIQAEKSSFIEAKLTNARFLGGSLLDKCNFSSAHLSMASFREASLKASCFDLANLEQADLELADLTCASLRKANLYRANMANTRFTNAVLEDANLMESILYHAQVTNADLRGANLYAANLLYMEHGNTRFDFANLDRTLLQDWQP